MFKESSRNYVRDLVNITFETGGVKKRAKKRYGKKKSVTVGGRGSEILEKNVTAEKIALR